MQLNKLFFFLLILYTFFLTSCHSEKISQKTVLSDEDYKVQSLSVTKIFLDAKRNLYKGNSTLAEKEFNKCLELQPNHDASYFELARMYEFIKPELSIEYISKAIKLSPDNNWYKEFLLRVYKQKKDYDNAIDIIKTLISNNPNRKQYYYEWANLCIGAEDYNQAMNAYNTFIEKFSYEEGVLKQQKQIYIKQGNYKKAIDVLDQLIEHNPNNKNYYGMVAEIYMNSGKPDKAFEYYNKILQIDPQDGFVHFSIADYYYKIGNMDMAFEELQKGMAARNLDVNAKIKVLMRMMSMAEKDSTYTKYYDNLMEIALKINPKSPKVLALNADYCNIKFDIQCAIKYLRKVIEIDSSKYTIWEQLIIAEEEIGNYQEVLNLSNRALRIFPQQAKLYYYSALAYGYDNNWKKAKERVKMGGNFVYKSIDKASFLALEAKAEFRIGENANAMANYQRAMSLDANNALIIKDYAFDLASFTTEYSKAVDLAQAALTIENGKAEYIYVYSYCLFKNGQKQEAINWVKPALEKYPQNKNLQMLDMEINRTK